MSLSVMQSCSPALCVLILLTTTLPTLFVSAVPAVKVKLHGSATLSCSERCSGLVRWTVSHKRDDTLAECDQTSCRSVKEGYQMIHHQYLNGNFTLIITDADFSKRNWYTCDCDGKDLCDVQLLIESLNTSVQIQSGESLVLDLDIPEEVEVIYNSTDPAGPSSGQICTVDGRSLQCTPEYTQRVSAAVTLRGVTPSDSGVYTIKDKLNEEVIHTYTVSVRSAGGGELTGDRSDLDTDRGAAVPVWVTVLLLVVLVAVMVVLVAVIVGTVVIVQLRREIQQLSSQMKNGSNGTEQNGRTNHSPDVETVSNK